MFQWGASMVEGLVPTFGIELYTQKIAYWMANMPREMSIIEGMVLGGLGASATILLLMALIRRSAIAAVSFSFLALTGLVAGLLFGRLDFLTSGTETLIVCLFACSYLLFVTATVRIARENPVIGVLLLLVIAGMLVIGGASALGIMDGWAYARVGLVTTIGLSMLFIIFEFFRGDRASMAVAPGLFAVAISPVLFSFIGNAGGYSSWMMASMPAMVLGGGAVFAAVAAQYGAYMGAREVRRTARGMRNAAMVPAAAVPLLREVGDDHGAHAPNPIPVKTPERLANRRRRYSELDQRDMSTVSRGREKTEPFYTPGGAAERSPMEEVPDEAPAPVRERFKAPEPTPKRAPDPQTDYSEDDGPTEPYSAQWGGGGAGALSASIAPEEYVWDCMADQEVKIGDAFASAFNIDPQFGAPPDVLREAIDPSSLDRFDDAVLGGSQPTTGRFDLDLMTMQGKKIRLEGRRQVDHEGILIRIEAAVAAAPGALTATAAPTAPARAPQQDRAAEGRRRGLAAATAAPLAAAPLAADRQGTPKKSGKPMKRNVPKVSPAVMALDAGQIEAHFQPIVRLADRETVGFEALARWRKDDGSVVEAKEFIDDLLKADRGLDLARITIDKAASELAAWIALQDGHGQFVTVNISATDLPKDELSDLVTAAVGRYNLPPGALVVELTEDRIKVSQSKALQAAKAVRDAGASLAIDDFGSGHSTLGRLSKFKFDLIKTDSSYIDGIANNKKKKNSISNLVKAARKAGVPVIAEGIEDEVTADILAELGCDFGQGYLFGKPEPVDDHHDPVPGDARKLDGYQEPSARPAAVRAGPGSDLR